MKKTVVSVATLTALTGTSLVNIDAQAAEVTVKSGDTLWAIANAVGTSVTDLKVTNNLSSNLIHPGDVLSYGQSFKENTKQTKQTKQQPKKAKQFASKSVDTYTVKAGDTLWAIGNQFGVSYQTIMDANNLKTDLIFPGQTLSLVASSKNVETASKVTKEVTPVKEETSVKEETPAVEEVAEVKETPVKEEKATGAYVIQSGDTLYKISRETGVDVNTLKAINGLKSDLIFPGQVLALTGKVVTPKVEEVPAVEEVVEETPVVEEVQPQPVQKVTEPVVDNTQVEVEQETQQATTEYQNQEQAVRNQEAAAQAERDRIAAEQAEANRIAAQQEQQRVAKQQAEQRVAEQVVEQKASKPAVVNTASKSQSSYGTNYYAYGDCAWYAFERRKQLGKGVSNLWGNGNDWADNARSNGYAVNNTPSVGAIVHSYAYTNGAYGYGHVAIVESINPDGSITVSEMGWPTSGIKTTRTISAGQVASHNFIH